MKTHRCKTKFTKNDLLNLKTRRHIYQFIFKNPGLHFREICRKLNISRGTVNYHTVYLEKRGLITAKRNSGYTRYYVINKYGTDGKNLLHNIKLDTPRNILFYLILCGSASQIELSKELKKHPSTIKFSLKRLIDLDIIEPAQVNNSTIHLNTKNPVFINRNKIGRELFYKIKNPMKLYDLLIIYYNKKYYEGDFADAFIHLVGDIYDKHSIAYPYKLKTFKQAINEVENIFFDVFPHPYHC